MKRLHERLAEEACDLLLADGFDDAFIGIGSRCGQPDVAVYARDACVQALMSEGLSLEDAEEHFDFNVAGAWVGDRTPVFVRKLS